MRHRQRFGVIGVIGVIGVVDTATHQRLEQHSQIGPNRDESRAQDPACGRAKGIRAFSRAR